MFKGTKIIQMLEINSVVVHFQGNTFSPSCVLVYQLADVEGVATDTGT
jgi:hypothetical protein